MIEGARGGRPAQSDAPRRAETPRQAETPREAEATSRADAPQQADAPRREESQARSESSSAEGSAPSTGTGRRGRGNRADNAGENARNGADGGESAPAGDEGGSQGDGRAQGDRPRREDGSRGGQRQARGQQNRDQDSRDQQGGRNDRGGQGGRNNQGGRNDLDGQGGRNDQGGQDGGENGPRGDGQNRDDDGGGRGRRGRRRRERNRGGNRPAEGETEVREDDVLQSVAGILDVLDNYAFVRTSGYLAGNNDVYVSMNMIRRYGLRRGDAITGAVKMPRDGQSDGQHDGPGGGQGGGRGGGQGGKNRAKFNPLARIDTVNGGPADQARQRPEFSKLTPLYPNQRLRLETEKNIISTRVIDLIMPIGKGQRALIVSPPKAGKTTILQNIANAIATNNPECHLMVVLVDERPEEVTDMQRSVKGEVIASTFDRPPSDHTQVAELAIERAKRLVELGQDVVVLLDSITRLGRAYNNSSPASGRILSGGVDSTALYPPKRFLGAARNIENGGSLTIIATAMVETGSAGDTVIFEEFKGTGNAELKLDRRIAERRVFPAVDVGPSGTRKEELLMSPEEAGIMHKLRRVLSGLDTHQAIDLLMSQLRKTNTNYEFLLQVAKTTPTLPQDEE